MNNEAGKDHWPITSMMLLGVGSAAANVQGGRVLGGTSVLDAEGNALAGAKASKVKVTDGRLEKVDDADPDGFLMKPAHVHQALRTAACFSVDNDALLGRFPLSDVPATPLPILLEE
jgi:hypothetical protein